ncbi:hypothetical protein J6590_049180 [Homalodisca vitripennis]|nr:hypothetical protein J6590_049180 [Homalodisca vitripennis]
MRPSGRQQRDGSEAVQGHQSPPRNNNSDKVFCYILTTSSIQHAARPTIIVHSARRPRKRGFTAENFRTPSFPSRRAHCSTCLLQHGTASLSGRVAPASALFTNIPRLCVARRAPTAVLPATARHDFTDRPSGPSCSIVYKDSPPLCGPSCAHCSACLIQLGTAPLTGRVAPASALFTKIPRLCVARRAPTAVHACYSSARLH